MTPTSRGFNLSVRAATGLFLAACILSFALAARPAATRPTWPDAFLVFTATILTLLSATRGLPFQNVLPAALFAAAIGSAATTLQVWSDWPAIHTDFTAAAGPRILNLVPWWIACSWPVAILASRGVAVLILQSRRSSHLYGLEIITLTFALSAGLGLCLANYTMQQGYWTGPRHAAPGACILYASAAAMVLAISTPFLINKKPGLPNPNYTLPLVWLALMLLFVASRSIK